MPLPDQTQREFWFFMRCPAREELMLLSPSNSGDGNGNGNDANVAASTNNVKNRTLPIPKGSHAGKNG